ncbi:inositol 1,4,5-triphosphate receptor associated 1 isoform X3 [Salmo salar]|uniref:Inositol 1,4,5-triphosphate receptor associated 1 isoform X3 n=1 Tax=Salmo salar TaxID=8030 RepID=A0ABM3DSF6_SALSA|nr:inositol 1,4,5-triphosphate receptor associated 1-like isoform X3 [Salmo salar]
MSLCSVAPEKQNTLGHHGPHYTVRYSFCRFGKSIRGVEKDINNIVLTLCTTLPNTGTMNAQKATPCEYAGILGDSSDSDEEPSPEDQLAISWEHLPILERLGLSSGTEMTEKEVENAFTQLALAFRCDQYTLTQRLQAEEHDRTVAQENFILELDQTRSTLQYLRGRCVDAEMLSRIEASLDTVLDGVSDIIAAAEMLGTVHQEARVCHSVEMMGIHAEHLKRRHAVERSELLESRKFFHRSRGRRHSDSEDGDFRHLFARRDSQQTILRRRVSVTLIPTGSEVGNNNTKTYSHCGPVIMLSDLETKFQEGCRASADTDSQGPAGGSVNQASRPSEMSPHHTPLLLRQSSTQSSQSLEEESEVAPHTSSLQMTLHHRRRSAIVAHEASSEEAEAKESRAGSGVGAGSGAGTSETSELSTCIAESVCTTEPLVVLSEQRPLATWLSYWTWMVLLLLALYFFLLLGFLLWGLKVPHHSSSF